MNKTLLAAAMAAVSLTSVPAAADPPDWAPAHGNRAKKNHDNRGHDNRQGQYRARQQAVTYDRYGRYAEPRALRRSDQVWRGNDGRYHCRRSNGTTGLIIGGAAGALLGRTIVSGRHRTVATLLGAAGGALLGREIDRGGLRCR